MPRNLSLLLAALFLPSLTVGMVEECCKEKRVGSIVYTLDEQPNSRGELPNGCLNNCVYTVVGASSPKFCFGKGFVGFLQMLAGFQNLVLIFVPGDVFVFHRILSTGDLPTECLSEKPGIVRKVVSKLKRI